MQMLEHLEPNKRYFFLDVLLGHDRFVHDLFDVQHHWVFAPHRVVNGEERQRLLLELMHIRPHRGVGEGENEELGDVLVLLSRAHNVLVGANKDNRRNRAITGVHSVRSDRVEPKDKKSQMKLELARIDVWEKPLHIEDNDIDTFATNIEVVKAIEGVLAAIVPARQPQSLMHIAIIHIREDKVLVHLFDTMLLRSTSLLQTFANVSLCRYKYRFRCRYR
mmetsp:Transcript_54462/g.88215  ORF Transcript_54462/g.88215 Transcript_54462/m.88215 type:complete len:220 (-) Transcript_54462:4095-4754(-)